MNGKASALLFAIAALRSLDLGASAECTTGRIIESQLSAVQFGTVTLRNGFARVMESINVESNAVLAVGTGRISSTPAEVRSRTAVATNETYAAFAIGILPFLQAISTFRPNLDFSKAITNLTRSMKSINNNIFLAIEVSQNASNTESKEKIAQHLSSTQTGVTNLLNGIFYELFNVSEKIPSNADSVIACVKAKIESGAASGVATVYDQINSLADGLANIKTDDDYDTYTAQMSAFNTEGAALFDAAIVSLGSMIRNLVIYKYSNSAGIIPALFALGDTRSF